VAAAWRGNEKGMSILSKTASEGAFLAPGAALVTRHLPGRGQLRVDEEAGRMAPFCPFEQTPVAAVGQAGMRCNPSVPHVAASAAVLYMAATSYSVQHLMLLFIIAGA
jgi:hypothetical protein